MRYSIGDILLNNIAWTICQFPLVLLPRNGHYKIQPVFVEDLAQLVVDSAPSGKDIELGAVGPEVFTYAQLVRMAGAKRPAPRQELRQLDLETL